MESVATLLSGRRSRTLGPVDGLALATWVLAGGLVLYLGLDGGGYDVIVSSQAGVIVW